MAVIRNIDTSRGLAIRRGNARRLLVAGAAALAAVGLLSPPGLAAVGGPATQAWSVLPSPDLSTPQGRLNGMSCASATACMAVGSAVSRSGAEVALAERWNGTSWAILNVPRPAGSDSLSGVSCQSASACTAVGFYNTAGADDFPLAERWNGTTWAIQPTPHRGTGSYLTAVSCASATVCTAVGATRQVPDVQTLAEQWNGTKWAIQPTVNVNGYDSLSAVSCPSASACTAVGSSSASGGSRALAERWNGTTWAVQGIHGPAGSDSLSAVSCPSPTVCTAVGSSAVAGGGVALAERWNGTAWAVQATPSPAGVDSLSGVSCPSATACTAVGSDRGIQDTSEATLAEAWNGTKWAVQPTPGPYHGQFRGLATVSCPSATACTAGGVNATAAGVALAETWNGVRWAIQRSRSPNGPLNSSLTGISCVSAAACTAVGGANENLAAGNSVTVAEAWNGTRWVVEPTPKAPGAVTGYLAQSGLSAVSCQSASACTAVGDYRAGPGFGYDAGLAERWNGTTWAVQPLPTSAEFSPLAGVSCPSATSCTAVGIFFKHTGPYQVLAERWNGTTWAVQATPNPAGSASVGGVSCPSATACTLVGSYESGDNQYTLAERWNGTTWSIQPTPNPAGSAQSYLTGVSCSSPTACTAVGYASGTKLGSIDVTLAERWNGTTWSIQPTPNPAGSPVTELGGVSCNSATACTAVGGPLAEAWNGSKWEIQHLAVPAGAGPGAFPGVYCQPAGPCTAVGHYSTGVVRPLVERRS